MKVIDNSAAAIRHTARPGISGLLTWINQHARPLLVALIATYIVVITAAAIRKFQLYRMGFDLAVTEQVVWNTLHGRPFETYAFDHTTSILGVDAWLILAIFVPFYAVVPSMATLLAVKTMIVGTSAIPIYLLARDHLKQRWAALAVAAAYLAYLPVMWGNLYEIRERVLAMAFIAWVLLCLHRRWYWRMLVPLLLALCCRLDPSIGIALLGVWTLLLRWPGHSHPGGENRRDVAVALPSPPPWRFTLTLIGSAIAAYLLITRWLIPGFTSRPGFLFLEHYSYLGRTPVEIVVNVLTNPLTTAGIIFAGPKLWYLLGMFLPLAFLPLLNWRLVLVMLPLYGLNLLSPRKIQWDVYHHYQGLIVPFMLLATIFGLASLVRRRAFGARTLEWGVGALLLGTLLSHAIFGNELIRTFKRWQPDERVVAANQLVAQVPDDVPVAVTNLVAPHLPPRRHLYLVPGGDFYYVAEPFANAQYALVDTKSAGGSETLEGRAVQAAIAGGGWCELDRRADYVLLKRQPGANGQRCQSP